MAEIIYNDELFKEILAELGYDESSVSEDRKKLVKGYIVDGIYKLVDVAGVELDFDVDRNARSLLRAYCRYANSQSLEMFEVNFQSELLSLNLNYCLKESSKDAES